MPSTNLGDLENLATQALRRYIRIYADIATTFSQDWLRSTVEQMLRFWGPYHKKFADFGDPITKRLLIKDYYRDYCIFRHQFFAKMGPILADFWVIEPNFG